MFLVLRFEGKGPKAPLPPAVSNGGQPPGAKKRLVMEEKRDEARAKLEGAGFRMGDTVDGSEIPFPTTFLDGYKNLRNLWDKVPTSTGYIAGFLPSAVYGTCFCGRMRFETGGVCFTGFTTLGVG